MAAAALAGLVPAANSQTNLLTCVTTAEAPLLRDEGYAERIGDIRLECRGGDPGEVKLINLLVFVNAGITSNLAGPEADESEALLLIDDPRPGVLNTSNGVTYAGQVKGTPGVLPGVAGGSGAPGSGNVYSGFRSPAGENRIEWNGIPLRPAPFGQSRILRLVNLRVDMSGFQRTPADPQAVTARLAVSLPNALPQGTNTVVVGYAAPALKTYASPAGGGMELVFEERFPEAFRKRIENAAGDGRAVRQDIPEFAYFTESGLTPEFVDPEAGGAGAADQGARLVIQFNDLPPGVFLTAVPAVDAVNRDGGPTGLEARRVVDFEADAGGGRLLNRGTASELVPVSGGQATLVYEVLAREPFAAVNGAREIDIFRVPVRVVYAQPNSLGGATVTLSLGPLNSTQEMSAAAPEPRFFVRDPMAGFFPLTAGPTLDYMTMRFTPGDPAPVARQKRFETSPVISSSVVVIEGTGWLTASARTRDTSEIVDFFASPEGLEPGRHQGAVAVRLFGASDDLVIVPVILDVNPPPEIAIDTTPVVIQAVWNAAPPDPRILFVNGRNKWLRFMAEAIVKAGAPWLAVEPASGQTPANLSIRVRHAGLVPGRYEGLIRIRAEAASNSPQDVPVILEVVPPLPLFSAAGVVNAASYQGGGISPGELITIFGENLGPDDPAGAQIGADGKVATLTGGTRVLFNGVAAPMLSASRRQVSCVVPSYVGDLGEALIQVELEGRQSGVAALPVRAVHPGVFSADSSGSGPGAILNQDGTLNTPANPAPQGSVISVFLTGLGRTQPAAEDGLVNPARNGPVPLAPVAVRIGGVESVVEFVGGLPGAVAGAMQLNVRVPATPGDGVPLQVLADGQSANIVTVSVAP